MFDFSGFFLPDGLFERLVCAVVEEETADDPEGRCLRGATVTANVARLATRDGKFRLEGEARVVALEDALRRARARQHHAGVRGLAAAVVATVVAAVAPGNQAEPAQRAPQRVGVHESEM